MAKEYHGYISTPCGYNIQLSPNQVAKKPKL